MTAIVRKLNTLDTKKTLLVVLTAGLLAFILSYTLAVSASGPQFNIFPITFQSGVKNRDLPLLDARNISRGEGWSASQADHDAGVSVGPGEIIEFSIYYHNGAADQPENIARNTRAQSNVVNGRFLTPSEFFEINAAINADNAAKVNAKQKGGTVPVKIEGGPAALSLVPGSVRHFPNQGVFPKPGPRQLPDNIFAENGGVNIGDVRGCFEFHGFVHFQVKVQGEAVQEQPGKLKIEKFVKNATKGTSLQDNEVTAEPGDLIAYRINIMADGNHVDNVVVKDRIDSLLRGNVFDVTLNSQPVSSTFVQNFFADGASIGTVKKAGSTKIRFRTRVPDRSAFKPGSHLLDNKAVAFTETDRSTDHAGVRVNIDSPPPPPPPEGQVRIQKLVGNVTKNIDVTDVSVSADIGDKIKYNIIVRADSRVENVVVRDVIDSRLRSGVFTANLDGNTLTQAQINQLFGSGLNIGSVGDPGNRVRHIRFRTVVPDLPVGKHNLDNAAIANGQRDNAVVMVVVEGPPPPPPPKQPSCNMDVFPGTIQRGQSATLSWSSEHTNRVFITGGVGVVKANGSRIVSPDRTTTFLGSFTGPGGGVNCSATLTVIIPPPPPPPPPSRPSCTINVFPGQILRGQNATLFWSSQNASSARINQGIGSVPVSGNRTVSPNQTTTFTMTVTGDDGRTATCQTTLSVFVVPPPPSDFRDLQVEKRVLNVSRNQISFSESVNASNGERVRFEIRVTATGNAAQSNVIVRDSLPSVFTNVSGVSTSLFGSGINQGDMSPGTSRTLTFEATLSSSSSFGTFVNTAFARSGQVGERLDSASVTTQVAGARFTQSKTAFNNTKGVDATTVAAEPGDIITYNLIFRNTGSITMTNVVIEDDISDMLELAAIANQGGAREVTGGVIRWDPVNIQAGGQVARTFQVRVKPQAEFPASSDRVMVNFFGNEVRVPVRGAVLGATTPPRTGAGEWFAGLFASLFTAGYWVYRRKPELLLVLKQKIVS